MPGCPEPAVHYSGNGRYCDGGIPACCCTVTPHTDLNRQQNELTQHENNLRQYRKRRKLDHVCHTRYLLVQP